MLKRFRGAAYLLTAGLVLAGGTIPAFSQTAAQPAAASGDEVSLLKQQVAAQQKMLEQMQATLLEMKARLDHAEQAPKASQASQTASAAPAVSARPAAPATQGASAPAALPEPRSLGQVASLTPVIPKAPEAATSAAATSALPATPEPYYFTNGASPADEQGLSPLSVKIGGATFTPGGFMDLMFVGRSTNVGSGLGTSFNGIPYSNAAQGQLSETRFSMQNSRISLDVNAKYVGFDWHGHLEADFLGFAPPNVFVGSNSNTLRSRLYWIDGRKGKFEFLGGQSWTMLTPNRTGLSANPSDLFYSQDTDTNYQVGLTWARQAQFRLIYHPTDIIAAGISIENQQQLYSSATVPSSMVAQGDNGSGSLTNANASNDPATPDLMPDIIGKIAFDPKTSGGLHQHIEIAGLLTSVRTFDPTAKVRNTTTGGGLSANFNFELVKNLHAILNTFYSDGGGRYIFALGPQFIINRDASGVYQPSLVHSGSGIAGLEYQVSKSTMLYGYYGGADYGRSYGIDCYTQPVVSPPPGTTPPPAVCNQTPSSSPVYIGYGYPKSPNSQNRTIQEGTFGINQTFWKNPHYGAIQIFTQYSYVTRTPWFIASGTPKNAHMSMAYIDLRYVLP
ncbi:MAG TPA: hypothetical protein VMT20_27385 [Terriglobia bacterium]|nr:hypothetical protein [Terriglobia bacterium]